MLVPPPDGVVADGAALTLTFDEQLDQDSEPAPGAFTLAVARPGAAAPPVKVTGVTLSGGEVVLTLSEPVRHGDTARLAYAAPAQNPLQDPAGNVAAGFGNRPVTVPANELATGTVEISPDRELYTVGDILTATVSGVADADGLPNPSAYEYQWLRIDGTLETPIDDMGTGKTKTYTLVDADAGKQVRVRLRFRDLGNNLEQLESAARPRYGRVMWPAADAVAAACATPEDVANGTEELIWTAEVTVGTGTRAGFTSPYGYSLLGGGFGFGDLTDHDFRFGNDNYTVDILIAHSDGLHFGLTSDLPPATAAGLVLHVCDEAFELRHNPGDSINYGSTSFAYSWGNDFLDWSGHSTRRVWLTRADTTAPMLLPQPDGVVVDGATLTLTFDEVLDAGSEPEPAKNAFTLAVTRPGAAASETEGIEVTGGVKVSGGEAVLTLSEPVLYGDTVMLAYAAPAAKPLQDPAGNAVAGFTRTAHNATPEGPRVVSVAFVQPPPPPPPPYKIDDVIEVDVTFTEAVTVTVGAVPPIVTLDFGDMDRDAGYVSGTGTDTLSFAYTVAAGDEDADGVAVARNGLALPPGSPRSTIVTTAAGEAVSLRHARVGDASRKVDGFLPTATAAEAGGAALTVTWSETLDETSVPSGAGGFTVKIDGMDGPAVRAVAVTGATAVLTLERGIRAGTADVTVSYAPPGADSIRDAAGNAALAFMDLAVTVVAVPNNPATGTVVFLILKPGSEERPLTAADTLTVGDTLTAAVVGLADPELYRTTPPESAFTWTWYWLDGATETAIAEASDIAGRAGASYTLADDDAGKHVRAKARFEDLLGNGETLASRRIGPVMFPAGSACMTPAAVANGSVELIWTAEVTVETGTRAGFTSPYGYSLVGGGFGFGDLTDHDFRFGNDNYTVDILIAHSDGLHFGLASDLPPATAAGLVLHVCDEAFELRHSPGDSIYYGSTSFDYTWENNFPDWSGHSTRRVWLTRADTTAPMRVGMPAVVGTELTLTYDEALDAASKPAADAFTLAVTRPGAAAPAIAVTDVALAGGELTLTLSEPVRHGDTATLTYRRATENPIQDPAGNEAAGFEDLAVTVRTHPNELATGTVEISPDRGPYTVGEEVTATVSGVADADGLPGTIAYEYQWIRIDGTLETPIDYMGTGKTYRLAPPDADKKFRARVRFLDDGNNQEQLESPARPRTGGVMWNADEACATPTAVANGTEELIWTAQVDVADLEGGNFGASLLSDPPLGGLSEDMFTLGGHRYRVASLQVGSGGVLVLEVGVEAADAAGLKLHVCDLELPFADGAPANFTWQWTHMDLDWSGHSTRRVWLTRADTTAPMLLPQPDGVVVDGATLTLTFDEALDATSEPAPPGGFTLAVTRPGAAASETEGIEVTDVDVSGVEAVLTLNEPVLYGDTVTLTYAAPTMSPLQDPAGNDVAGFTRTAHDATPEGPTVESVALVGGPAPAPACAIPEKIAYAIGETIMVNVTFSEAVRVTPAAPPTLALEIDLSGGGQPPQAVYVSGTGSDVLRFEYTVVEGDLDADGIAVARNGLALPAGGTIVTTAADETVILRHARAFDALHKVDGVLPVALAATAAGPTVTVTWSERLCEDPDPSGAGGFRVKIGSAAGPAVDAVAVAGATATLTLASAIADGTQDATLEYTPPGTDPIRDAAGNEALAFPRTGADPADALEVTVTPDTRAPELAGTPTVDGATLVATFDEALDPDSIPDAPGGFTVTVTRGPGNTVVPGHAVSGIAVSERTVTLTLMLPVRRGRDTVTLDYDPPSTKPLQDSAATPNPVAAFSGRDVDNRTPSVTGVAFAEPAPAPACAIPEKIAYKIDDTIEVEARFTEAVRVSGQPVVTLDIGGEPRPAVYVSGTGSDTLVFAYPVVEGDLDEDGIAIPGGALTAPSGSAIVTLGGRTVLLGHDAVAADTARPVEGVRPRATAAEAAGPRVTVTWSERLCEAPVPSDAGGFRVKIGSADGPAVDAVAVAGATTVLTLADAIADGTQDATLEYTPPSSGRRSGMPRATRRRRSPGPARTPRWGRCR